MGRLAGKVAVILGASAPQSMGAAAARLFAREGARVVVAARRREPIEALAREIGGTAQVCDITKESDLAALAALALKTYGKLDIAVNFAGVHAGDMKIADETRETLLPAVEAHFVGTVLFIKNMAAAMKEGGSIVTTSSITAHLSPPGLAAYAGSKAGADHIVRIAAIEYGPRKIRVNAIVPGFTRSAMTEGYFQYPAVISAFERETPLGRLGTVNDIANAALFLASDEAFMTGQSLQINGGITLRRVPTADEMQ